MIYEENGAKWLEHEGNMYEDYYTSDPFKLFVPIHKDIRPQGTTHFVDTNEKCMFTVKSCSVLLISLLITFLFF